MGLVRRVHGWAARSGVYRWAPGVRWAGWVHLHLRLRLCLCSCIAKTICGFLRESASSWVGRFVLVWEKVGFGVVFGLEGTEGWRDADGL